jgi:hypothetical protein
MVEAGGCVAALPIGTTGVTLAPALHLLSFGPIRFKFQKAFVRLFRGA